MAQPHELTLATAASEIRTGNLSPLELMESLLARSRSLEPLNVWATLDEEAALAAARKSQETGDGGPLHGVPFGVKDIFNTAGVKTAAGSKILADFVPDYDSTAVALLKAAGGVMMGKTVTTEFAMFDPPATRNPWNADRTPGGSSSGSAAGTPARMFPVALGSQTAGSVLRPASYNGVVGMKPTLGLISRYGVLPVARSLDTMGFFTRSVLDAALMLSAMARHDPNDEISLNESTQDYAAALDQPISPPRIGVMRQHFFERATPEVRAHTDGVVARLVAEGAIVEDVSVPSGMSELANAHITVQNIEAASIYENDYRTRASDMAPKVQSVIEAGLAAPAVEYVRAQDRRRIFTREIVDAIKPFDVILTPSTPAPAPDTSTTGDTACQWPWTTCGFPTITIPSGLSADQMPLGVQLAAGHLAESRLLQVSKWCEDVIDVNLTPPVD